MNNLDTLLQEFDNLYDNFKLSNTVNKVLSSTVRGFITKAYNLGEVTGAEKHANLSELGGYFTSGESYDEGWEDAIFLQKEKSQKALEQIKQQQVLNTIKKEV